MEHFLCKPYSTFPKGGRGGGCLKSKSHALYPLMSRVSDEDGFYTDPEQTFEKNRIRIRVINVSLLDFMPSM